MLSTQSATLAVRHIKSVNQKAAFRLLRVEQNDVPLFDGQSLDFRLLRGRHPMKLTCAGWCLDHVTGVSPLPQPEENPQDLYTAHTTTGILLWLHLLSVYGEFVLLYS